MKNILRLNFLAVGLLIIPYLSSCLSAPLSFTMSNSIQVGTDELSDSIEKITEYYVDHGIAADEAASCISSYKTWVNNKIAEGFIPSKSEMREYTSTTACPSVDTQQLSVKAVEDFLNGDGNKTGSALFIDPSEMGKQYRENDCLKEALDKGKTLNITKFFINIKSNTFNYPVSLIELYYTDRNITNEDLEKKDFKKKNQRDLTLIGYAAPQPKGSTGEISLKPVLSATEYQKVVENIGGLKGKLIAFIGPYIQNPEYIKNKNIAHDLFVLPDGKMEIQIGFNIEITASLSTALCAYREEVKKAQKEDEEKRKEFEDSQSKR